MTKKITKRRLQQALNGLTSAHNRAFKWRMIIKEYSEQMFGVDPADIDCDSFIDACDGGAGISVGMTAEDFFAAMADCLEDIELWCPACRRIYEYDPDLIGKPCGICSLGYLKKKEVMLT